MGEGCAPTLSSGRGVGKPGFPTLVRGGRSPPQPSPQAGEWGNPVSPHSSGEGAALPNPPHRQGNGETRFPHTRPGRAQPSPQAGEWGNPVSPHSSWEGTALPTGRGMGKPGFPRLVRGGRSPPQPSPQGEAWGNPVSPHSSWEGAALPNPPHRQGNGETRFPQTRPGRAQPSPTLSSGRGVGKPGFPTLVLGGLYPPKPSRARAIFRSGEE